MLSTVLVITTIFNLFVFQFIQFFLFVSGCFCRIFVPLLVRLVATQILKSRIETQDKFYKSPQAVNVV